MSPPWHNRPFKRCGGEVKMTLQRCRCWNFEFLLPGRQRFFPEEPVTAFMLCGSAASMLVAAPPPPPSGGVTPHSCVDRCSSASRGSAARRENTHGGQQCAEAARFHKMWVCVLCVSEFVNCYRRSGWSQALINWDNWCLLWVARKLSHPVSEGCKVWSSGRRMGGISFPSQWGGATATNMTLVATTSHGPEKQRI